MPNFRKILIANRGEISRRITRSAHQLSLQTVAVFTASEKDALYVQDADEAYSLGDDNLSTSFLSIEAILDAAKACQVDAIHPGYGFLAENPDFAHACREAGFYFIGPSEDAMRTMGDKSSAKALVQSLDIPTVPGFPIYTSTTPHEILDNADIIGYPLIIKAANGGGGRGMRLVNNADEILRKVQSARQESLIAFNSADLLVEKQIVHAQHIEVQIAADNQGHVLHLFERECSLQRRYQKIIEESPASHLSATLRDQLWQAAIKIAKAINYTGLGTVEFLVADQAMYFIEMNTRLQVEHPVTEMITGFDLIEWQITIAEGRPLPVIHQDKVYCRGHAIEARWYAEDPFQQFMPQTGTISLLEWPAYPPIRIDHSMLAGDKISSYFDPMIAKFIAHGKKRSDAIRQLKTALEQTKLIGVNTNQDWLINLLQTDDYLQHAISTDYLDHQTIYIPDLKIQDLDWFIAAALFFVIDSASSVNCQFFNCPFPVSMKITAGNMQREAVFTSNSHGKLSISIHLNTETVKSIEYDAKRHKTHLFIGNHLINCFLIRLTESNTTTLIIDRKNQQIKFQHLIEENKNNKTLENDEAIIAPVDGTVLNIAVNEQQPVNSDDPLITIEAMKIEHTIKARKPRVIHKIHVGAGERVTKGTTLVTFE